MRPAAGWKGALQIGSNAIHREIAWPIPGLLGSGA